MRRFLSSCRPSSSFAHRREPSPGPAVGAPPRCEELSQQGVRPAVEPEAGLLLLVPVAGVAVLGEDGLNVAAKIDLLGGAGKDFTPNARRARSHPGNDPKGSAATETGIFERGLRLLHYHGSALTAQIVPIRFFPGSGNQAGMRLGGPGV